MNKEGKPASQVCNEKFFSGCIFQVIYKVVYIVSLPTFQKMKKNKEIKSKYFEKEGIG